MRSIWCTSLVFSAEPVVFVADLQRAAGWRRASHLRSQVSSIVRSFQARNRESNSILGSLTWRSLCDCFKLFACDLLLLFCAQSSCVLPLDTPRQLTPHVFVLPLLFAPRLAYRRELVPHISRKEVDKVGIGFGGVGVSTFLLHFAIVLA